jgi:hypothetical protein
MNLNPGLSHLTPGLSFERARLQPCRYSIFGNGVDRKHTLKWPFPQEKATFHCSQKVYVYSENALKSKRTGL